MKTISQRAGDRGIAASQNAPYLDERRPPLRSSILWPAAILSAMAIAILLLDAVLPLRDFWFHEAMLTQWGIWPVWPSLVLFPGWMTIAPVPFMHASGTPDVLQSWIKFPILLGAFLLVFVIYLVAIRRLPEHISWRYLWRSTAALGILYMLIPAVTSPDLYSYIAYARIGALYHLNPLTTLPTAIHTDLIYKHISWVDQPSAYGPTWALIACFLQWVIALFGNTYILPMVIALRVLGFALHLVSTWLVWSISGKLQQLNGDDSVYASRRRLRATLAFAWNPLLLFEACVNAHNDTLLLVFILLMIWALVHEKTGKIRPDLRGNEPTANPGRRQAPPYTAEILQRFRSRVGAGLAPALAIGNRLVGRIAPDMRAPLAAAALLALATCLKINAVLLFPGLAFYVWAHGGADRRIKRVLATTAGYAGVIVLLYLPFWQGGAIFNVFQVNPGTYRTVNTPADFLAHFYNTMAGLFGYAPGAPVGSPAERFMHTFSMGIFVLLYLVVLWRALRAPWRTGTLGWLIGWLAVVWLLYCAIGSPWFWPWYIVTFFGLYALLEASPSAQASDERSTGFPWRFWPLRTPWMARLLVFSMLSLYCLMTWGPAHSTVPGLPGFLWSYLGGLWAWLLPLAGTALLARRKTFLTEL